MLKNEIRCRITDNRAKHYGPIFAAHRLVVALRAHPLHADLNAIALPAGISASAQAQLCEAGSQTVQKIR